MTNHPYEHFESHPCWSVLEQALEELVENRDFVVATPRPYIVGSLTKALVDAGLVPEKGDP